jgi:hypothetical protein
MKPRMGVAKTMKTYIPRRTRRPRPRHRLDENVSVSPVASAYVVWKPRAWVVTLQQGELGLLLRYRIGAPAAIALHNGNCVGLVPAIVVA